MRIKIDNVLYVDTDTATFDKFDEENDNLHDYVDQLIKYICQDFDAECDVVSVSECCF